MEGIIKLVGPYASVLVLLLLYLAEHVFPQKKETAGIEHDVFNLGVGLFNFVIIFAGGYYLQKTLVLCHAQGFGMFNIINIPLFVAACLQVIILDLGLYWWHRINHRFPFLWRFHKFHHADTMMNSTTALRFHSVELLLSIVVKFFVSVLFGISVMALLLHGLLLFLVVLLHHSNIRIGEKTDLFLRKFIVTPRMHRIHHSKNRSEANSNYSSLLSFWDSLFKTYRKNAAGDISFGID